MKQRFLAVLLAMTGSTVIGSFLPAQVIGEQMISCTSGGIGSIYCGDSRFGFGLSGVSDLDGDGLDELVVGADLSNNWRGEISVLFLASDGTVASSVQISNGKGGFPDNTLNIEDQFGNDVVDIGDLDQDGASDLAVGCHGRNIGSGTNINKGSVFILFMDPANPGHVKPGGVVELREGTNGAPPVFAESENFGASVALIGDLDDDGIQDLAIGADPGWSNSSTMGGRMWICFMNRDGTIRNYTEISESVNGFTHTLDTNDRFGIASVGLGDLDQDGVEDLAVGAYGDDDGELGAGAVYILFLKTDGSVDRSQKISNLEGGFSGVNQHDALGRGLAWNGATNELVVGAHGYDGPTGTLDAVGQVWLLVLDTDGTVLNERVIEDGVGGFGGPLPDAGSFGHSTSFIGDLNQDGRLDMAVGSPHDTDGGYRAGAVWVLFRGEGTSPAARPHGTQRISVNSLGEEANDWSLYCDVSSDGRYVVFESAASNLVPNDNNNHRDVFLMDRRTGQVELISKSSQGVQGDGDSFYPSITPDGRFIAFYSWTSNLVPNDTNGIPDVFVHDRSSAETFRVSVDSSGVQGTGWSEYPAITPDGRFVVFRSAAANLVAGDTNNAADIFLHDRQTGATERISLDSTGSQADSDSIYPAISDDGNLIAFQSSATNLDASDINGVDDVFLRDRAAGTTALVSRHSDGTIGNGDSTFPVMNSDGSLIAFHSSASSLVDQDQNSSMDVFLHDRVAGATTRVSVDSAGLEGNGDSLRPSLSDDGSIVAYYSLASNLVPGDTNGAQDVFRYHRLHLQTSRWSLSSAGEEGNRDSFYPALSGDGRFLAFVSKAEGLVPDDANQVQDIYIHGGPTLSSIGSCPGAVDFTVENATPYGQVVFLWGNAGHGYLIPPGFPCSPLQIDLEPLWTPSPGYQVVFSDPGGTAAVQANVPSSACGAIVLQAIDLDSCTKTNLIQL